MSSATKCLQPTPVEAGIQEAQAGVGRGQQAQGGGLAGASKRKHAAHCVGQRLVVAQLPFVINGEGDHLLRAACVRHGPHDASV